MLGEALVDLCVEDIDALVHPFLEDADATVPLCVETIELGVNLGNALPQLRVKAREVDLVQAPSNRTGTWRPAVEPGDELVRELVPKLFIKPPLQLCGHWHQLS